MSLPDDSKLNEFFLRCCQHARDLRLKYRLEELALDPKSSSQKQFTFFGKTVDLCDDPKEFVESVEGVPDIVPQMDACKYYTDLLNYELNKKRKINE